jgi:hypothetical protein
MTDKHELELLQQISILEDWLYQTMAEVEFRQNVSLKKLPEELIVWWELKKEEDNRRKREAAEQARRDELILCRALTEIPEYTQILLKKHWGIWGE